MPREGESLREVAMLLLVSIGSASSTTGEADEGETELELGGSEWILGLRVEEAIRAREKRDGAASKRIDSGGEFWLNGETSSATVDGSRKET